MNTDPDILKGLDQNTKTILQQRLTEFKVISVDEWQQLRDNQEAIEQLKRTLIQQIVQDEEERIALKALVASLKEQIVSLVDPEKQVKDDQVKKEEELKIREMELEKREENLKERMQEFERQFETAEKAKEDEAANSAHRHDDPVAKDTIVLLSERIKDLEGQLAEHSILKRLAEREQRLETTQRILHERAARLKENLMEKEAVIADLRSQLETSSQLLGEANSYHGSPNSTADSGGSPRSVGGGGEFRSSAGAPHAWIEYRRLVRAFILAMRQNDSRTKQAILPALCALSDLSAEESCSVLKGLTPLPRL